MMVHITPKKVNNMKELVISATFKHQSVKYESRFKCKADFIRALKKTNDMFVDLVDLNTMQVIKRDDLKQYINA